MFSHFHQMFATDDLQTKPHKSYWMCFRFSKQLQPIKIKPAAKQEVSDLCSCLMILYQTWYVDLSFLHNLRKGLKLFDLGEAAIQHIKVAKQEVSSCLG